MDIVGGQGGELPGKLLEAARKAAHRSHILHHAADADSPAPGLGRHHQIDQQAYKIRHAPLQSPQPEADFRHGEQAFPDEPGTAFHLAVNQRGLPVQPDILSLLVIVGKGVIEIGKQPVDEGHGISHVGPRPRAPDGTEAEQEKGNRQGTQDQNRPPRGGKKRRRAGDLLGRGQKQAHRHGKGTDNSHRALDQTVDHHIQAVDPVAAPVLHLLHLVQALVHLHVFHILVIHGKDLPGIEHIHVVPAGGFIPFLAPSQKAAQQQKRQVQGNRQRCQPKKPLGVPLPGQLVDDLPGKIQGNQGRNGGDGRRPGGAEKHGAKPDFQQRPVSPFQQQRRILQRFSFSFHAPAPPSTAMPAGSSR